MSLQQFIGVKFLEKKILILIFGIATFCLKHCLNSPRHTFNQILTNRWFYLLPLLLKPIPQLMNTTRRFFILPKLLFDIVLAFLLVCFGSFSCWKRTLAGVLW